jgi:hypothetical protein
MTPKTPHYAEAADLFFFLFIPFILYFSTSSKPASSLLSLTPPPQPLHSFHTSQVLLRWSIDRGVPVLARTADPAHAAEAAAAVRGGWSLEPGARAALDRLETRARAWRPAAAWPDPEAGGVAKPTRCAALVGGGGGGGGGA